LVEKILTKHPDGKAGVNIEKKKYEQMKTTIINILDKKKQMTFNGLMREVEKKLEGKFNGSIGWYYTTVKLDLEARKIISRIPGTSPQILVLNKDK